MPIGGTGSDKEGCLAKQALTLEPGSHRTLRGSVGMGIGLSDNLALPWSLELIERFADRWDWETVR